MFISVERKISASGLTLDKREQLNMKRFLIILGTGAFVVALLAGLAILAGAQTPVSVSAAPPAAGAEIEINNFAFSPSTMTVPVGAQVTWTNKDEIGHNVVSSDKTIKSQVLDTDEKFTFTFTQPGTFSYICTIHPRMKGTIVVQ
jgi:plastocyanin